MFVELTEGESAALREVLDRTLGDMSMEIAATDNPAFRTELRAHRDALRSVAQKLAGNVPLGSPLG
jgi:hypothetical protein